MCEASLDEYLAKMRSGVESIQRDAKGSGSLRLSKSDLAAVIRLTNRVLDVIESAEVIIIDGNHSSMAARTRARPDLTLLAAPSAGMD